MVLSLLFGEFDVRISWVFGNFDYFPGLSVVMGKMT
jgi:hypothetical protein